MERTHDELRSLIAPYVLGAVPEDEVAMIRAHIVTCEECMAEAERFAEATTLSRSPGRRRGGASERVRRQGHRSGAARGRSARPASSSLVAERVRRCNGGPSDRGRSSGCLVARCPLRCERTSRSDGSGRERGSLGSSSTVTSPSAPSCSPAATRPRSLQPGSKKPLRGRPTNFGTSKTALPLAPAPSTHATASRCFGFLRSSNPGSAAAVTIEPTGGSDQPTTDPILASV